MSFQRWLKMLTTRSNAWVPELGCGLQAQEEAMFGRSGGMNKRKQTIVKKLEDFI